MNPIKLTHIQEQALDTTRNILVRASAGSGKTTILVQRFLKLFYDDPNLDPSQVLAITYTNKAASEMLERVRSLAEKDFTERLIYNLPRIQISTIHAFCQSMLKQFPLESGVDPACDVLDDEAAFLLRDQAIKQTLDACQKNRDSDFRQLLHYLNLERLCENLHTFLNKKEQYQAWLTEYAKKPTADFLADYPDLQDEALTATKKALELTASMARLYFLCLSCYQDLKFQTSKLDFADILDFAFKLAQKPAVQAYYQNKLKFILIDEFQDTDARQWEFIHNLVAPAGEALNQTKLFLVGDEKQAIYGFRGINPRLFSQTVELFSKTPATCKVINACENFRSAPIIINFANSLFDRLFAQTATDYQIDYLPLQAKLSPIEPSFIEYAFINTDEKQDKNNLIQQEAQFIGQWILAKMLANPQLKFKDFVLLFRSATHIDAYKETLTRLDIPNNLASGRTFYEQAEILDMYQLIKGLANYSDNLSWIGVLKSPLVSLSDEAIFWLYNAYPQDYVLDKIFAATADKWVMLGQEDQSRFALLKEQLKKWLALTNIMPIADLLDQILTETQSWQKYRSAPLGQQRIANLHKFIAKIRQLTHNSFACWAQVQEILTSYVENVKHPQENLADDHENAVRLMTIHKAKGLEFPIVILPQLHRKFNNSSHDTFLFHAQLGLGLSYKHGKGENALRKDILAKIQAETIEEEKRLFYVACTRAKQSLLFTGVLADQSTPAKDQEENKFKSFLDFLLEMGLPKYQQIDVNEQLSTNKASQTVAAELTPPIHVLEPSNAFPPFLCLPVTKLTEYLKCAKKYYYADLLQAYSKAVQHDRADIGLQMHAILAQIVRLPNLEINILNSLANTEETQNLLTNFIASSLFADIKKADFRLAEEPFAIKLGQMIIEGRIDCVLRFGQNWQIIDYKTDAVTLENYQAKAQKYRQSLMNYAVAIHKMFQVPANKISARLFFLKINQEVLFTFEEAELQTLEAQIQALYETLKAGEFGLPNADVCQECELR